jgi:hypothetical protein
MKSKLITPHAAVLIWSYDNRGNADGTSVLTHAVEQVIIGTSSLISVSTTKRKSSPAGSFEFRLAPRFNWVSRITPGSWCAILMSRDPLPSMSKENVGVAQQHSFKMLGRIDSVRAVVEVNQETGARSTVFVVTGQDWGSVFESNLYIDYSIQHILTGNSIAQAYTILGLQQYETLAKEKKLPTSKETVDTVINLWGMLGGTAISNSENIIAEAGNPTVNKLLLSSGTQFQLPSEVAKFMRQGLTIAGIPIGPTKVNFAEIIHRQHGRLTQFDDPKVKGIKYEEVDDSYGVLNPDQFIGKHTFWQLLTDASNTALYELVNDIRWDGQDQPYFTLYHRIRPFVTRTGYLAQIAALSLEPKALAAQSTVRDLENKFENVRRLEIPLEDVVNINYGTNWRDKVNFIEMRPNAQLIPDAQSLLAKIDGQTVDVPGFQRDGFKPMFVQCSFLPFEGSQIAIDKLGHWKYLLREWYFNNHMMLNGSMTIIGQNQYIQVGDNIIVDAQVLGNAPLNFGQKANIFGKKLYLLAHVENIMHSFSVNQETGARTFSTTIQFVRGVISDANGKSMYPAHGIEAGAIDKSASLLTPEDERNSNTFGSSVNSDPDVQKLNKGKGLV